MDRILDDLLDGYVRVHKMAPGTIYTGVQRLPGQGGGPYLHIVTSCGHTVCLDDGKVSNISNSVIGQIVKKAGAPAVIADAKDPRHPNLLKAVAGMVSKLSYKEMLTLSQYISEGLPCDVEAGEVAEVLVSVADAILKKPEGEAF